MFEKDGVIFFDRIDLNGNLIQTAEEAYNAWANREQIDICTEPTTEERVLKLEEEKSILAENVYQLASIVEVMLTGGTEDDETGTVTTDTAN